MKTFYAVLSWVSPFLVALSALAANPPCRDNRRPDDLPFMNKQVLRWKAETPNQFLARAYVRGRVVKMYRSRPRHAHFEIQIGPGPRDTLEVVYNLAFGALPPLQPGMIAEACGDYITSRAPVGPLPHSPDGAIIHWVHFNPGDRDHGRHEHGFVSLNGVVYGWPPPAWR